MFKNITLKGAIYVLMACGTFYGIAYIIEPWITNRTWKAPLIILSVVSIGIILVLYFFGKGTKKI